MQLLLLVLLLAPLLGEGTPQARVPTPESVFGFAPGTDRKLADYTQIREFYRRLDAASDRVELFEIGPTAEGRPMILAAISSEANLRQRDRHRETARRLADARGLDDGAAHRLAREGKAIAWIDFGLHATEVAHAQVSPELAFELATSESDEARRIRESVIVLVMPVMNPDGLEIVTSWYRRNVGTPFETSPLPVLYQKHAGHDNNRDWFMQNLPETRNVTRQLYREWHPQIVYNHHQSGVTSPRIWAPPMDDPVNPNMHALVNRGISLLGVGIMQRLEQEGRHGSQGYSTYSNWWNGGMRSTPCFHNVVSILTEVASGRYATPVEVKNPDLASVEPSTWNPSPWRGGLWRLRDQMDYMATATWAVLRLAAEYREDWLYNRYQMARDQIELGKKGNPYAFVVPPEQHDPGSAMSLIGVLTQGAVEVQQARSAFSADGKPYPADTRVILMAQPNRGFAKDLLEPQRHPDRREYPGGPPKRPYDIAGWTLPYQMGVRVDAISRPFTVELGNMTAFVPLRVWTGNNSLDRKENDAVRFSMKALKAGNSLRATNQHLITGKAISAPPEARNLRLPRVGLYKSFVASMDEGWTRFILEQFEMPYTSIGNKDVRAGNLAVSFDAIVLASQSADDIVAGHKPGTMPPEYAGGIGDEGVAALRAFVEAGGTLVAIDRATLVPIKRFGLPLHDVLEGVRNTEFYCPGSILRLDVDTSHRFAAGMPAQAAATFVHSRAFDLAGGSSAKIIARYAERDLLMSGWINGAERIAGKAAVVDVPLGRGRVVLIGFSALFRGQPHGTFKLLFNPILEAAAAR